jgi:hypothetical protein
MQAGGAQVTGDGRYRDPRWDWPEYAPGSVVEVRVHGVGGEEPEGLTRDPHPVRVGGDDRVGFWRARNPEVGPGHVREVVSWGGATSGGRRSAFWVLLLPFALFNAAGRMAPLGADDRHARLHASVCRLLALSMTLTVVALTGGIVLDLLALQCGASTTCATADLTGRWLLAPLRWFPGDAAALVGLLALVPAGVPYVLRVLGRRGVTTGGRPTGWDAVTLQPRAPRMLHADDAWHGLWPAWRLRGIHITAGYAWTVVLLALLLPPLLPGSPGWLGPATLTVGVGSVLGNALLAALPRVAGTAPSIPLGRAILALRWVTLLALGGLVGTGLSRALDPGGPEGWRWWALFVPAVVAAGWSTLLHVQHVREAAPAADDTVPGPPGTSTAAGTSAADATTDGHAGAPATEAPAAGVEDVVHVTSAAGPSGAVRDALLAGGVAGLAILLAVAGTGRVAAADAIAALPTPTSWLDTLLGGSVAVVHGPTWVLVLVQTVLLLVLAATSFGRVTPTRTGRGPLVPAAVPGNLAAPVLALLSLLLVAAIGGGLHAFVLDWLGRRVAQVGDLPALAASAGDAAAVVLAAPREAVGLALPWWHGLIAHVVLDTVVVLGLAAVALRLQVARQAPTRQDVTRAVARTLAPPPRGDDPARDRAVDDALDRTGGMWLDQALLRRAGTALGAAVLVVLLGVVVVLARGLATGDLTAELPGTTLALTLVALVPPGAVLLVRAAREDRVVRRQVGALWDVLAFWPRTTHPFSPPSYGEALVPALVARLNALPEGSPVLLAGHSQGSVVVVAASLSPLLRHRPLHLVTYGSPLGILYEGFFPTVFGGDGGAIARATPMPAPPPPQGTAAPAAATTWHNVFAVSEPFATPLWSGSTGATPTNPRDDAAGWPVSLRTAWQRCPVCAWSRPVPDGTDAVTPSGGDGMMAADVTITDPDRVVSNAGEVDGAAAGHSSYHRSRELDLHLAHLAVLARDIAAGDDLTLRIDVAGSDDVPADDANTSDHLG